MYLYRSCSLIPPPQHFPGKDIPEAFFSSRQSFILMKNQSFVKLNHPREVVSAIKFCKLALMGNWHDLFSFAHIVKFIILNFKLVWIFYSCFYWRMIKRKHRSFLNYFNSHEKNSKRQFEAEKYSLNNSNELENQLSE